MNDRLNMSVTIAQASANIISRLIAIGSQCLLAHTYAPADRDEILPKFRSDVIIACGKKQGRHQTLNRINANSTWQACLKRWVKPLMMGTTPNLSGATGTHTLSGVSGSFSLSSPHRLGKCCSEIIPECMCVCVHRDIAKR